MFAPNYFLNNYFAPNYFPNSVVTVFVLLSARSGFKITDSKVTSEKLLPLPEVNGWTQEKQVQDNLEVNQRWKYETSKFPPR